MKSQKDSVRPLVITSKSTEKHKSHYQNEFKNENIVIGIGGGAVLDSAKICAWRLNIPCICIPTTASGASMTRHAVKWTNKKISIKTGIPMTLLPPFEINLPEQVRVHTEYDVLAHAIETHWSKRSTTKGMMYATIAMALYKKGCTDKELVMAGCLAGMAIEHGGTNIMHAISYPLTSIYGIEHGKALGMIFHRVCKFMGQSLDISIKLPRIPIPPEVDREIVANAALGYDKIQDTGKAITKNIIKRILT